MPHVTEIFAFRVRNISCNIHFFLRTDWPSSARVPFCPHIPFTQSFKTRVTNPPVLHLTFLLQFDEYLTWHAENIHLYNSTHEFMLKYRLFFKSYSSKSRFIKKRWSLTTNIHGVTYQRGKSHRCDKQNPHHFILSSLFASLS
jgi:hypothetical protein